VRRRPAAAALEGREQRTHGGQAEKSSAHGGLIVRSGVFLMNPMKDPPGPREDGPGTMTSMGRYAAMLSTLSALGTSPALAAGRGCAPVPVETDALVRAEWPDLPERIRGVLDGRGDVDRCARIRLRRDQAAVFLEVVLPDGRSASRSLARVDDVVPTLEALLLLPRPDAPAPQAEPVPATAPAEPRPRAGDAKPVVSARFEQPAPPARGWFRLEFSLAAGARIGDGQAGVGIAALTFFDLRGWLVGFEGATQRYRATDGGPPAAGVQELAVLAGRRFQLGDTALDLTAGPALATRGFGSGVSVRVEGGSPPTRVVTPASSEQSKRLLWGARLTFRPRAVVRLFAGIDGELALEGAGTSAPPGEAPMPSWIVGLVLGTTVGTP